MHRKLVCCLIAVLLLLLLFPLAASARSYNIPSARFDIRLNTDGSADVTENWTVTYAGEYSRFFKDITYRNQEEHYSSVEMLGVSIDGTECAPTDDTENRPDYHYNLSSGTATQTISAYLASTDCTRVYSFRYRLKDAVKWVDDTYYLFSYRVIGANFEQRVDSIGVTVSAPDSCRMKVLYKTAGTETISDSSAAISCDGKKGLFKVKVRMDADDGGDLFLHAAPLKSNQLQNENQKDENNISAGYYLLVILGAVIVFFPVGLMIVLFCVNRVHELKIRRKYKNDPGYVGELVRSIQQHIADPLQAAMTIYPVHGPDVFCVLAQMDRQRQLRIDRKNCVIEWSSVEGANEAQTAVLCFLEEAYLNRNGDLPADGTPWPHTLSFSQFLSCVSEDRAAYFSFEQNVFFLLTKKEKLPKAALKTRDDAEYLLLKYGSAYRFEDLLDHLNSTPDDVFPYVYFLSSDFPGGKETAGDLQEIDFNGQLMHLIGQSIYLLRFEKAYQDRQNAGKKKKSSDGSSCTSCSSCSSCSSCGDGGGD